MDPWLNPTVGDGITAWGMYSGIQQEGIHRAISHLTFRSRTRHTINNARNTPCFYRTAILSKAVHGLTLPIPVEPTQTSLKHRRMSLKI